MSTRAYLHIAYKQVGTLNHHTCTIFATLNAGKRQLQRVRMHVNVHDIDQLKKTEVKFEHPVDTLVLFAADFNLNCTKGWMCRIVSLHALGFVTLVVPFELLVVVVAGGVVVRMFCTAIALDSSACVAGPMCPAPNREEADAAAAAEEDGEDRPPVAPIEERR